MSCDNCDGDVTELPDGYVCSECHLLVVEGSATGWQIVSRRLIA